MYKWTYTVQNHVFSRVNCVYHVLALIIPEHSMHIKYLTLCRIVSEAVSKNKAEAVEILVVVS